MTEWRIYHSILTQFISYFLLFLCGKNINMRLIPPALGMRQMPGCLYIPHLYVRILFSTCRTAVLTLGNVRWENKYRHLNSLHSNFSASKRGWVLKDGGGDLCRWFNILEVTRLSLRTGNEKWDVHYREGINNLIICENDLWDSFYANVKHT